MVNSTSYRKNNEIFVLHIHTIIYFGYITYSGIYIKTFLSHDKPQLQIKFITGFHVPLFFFTNTSPILPALFSQSHL